MTGNIRRKKKKISFYGGLLRFFLGGLVVIAIGMLCLYVSLDQYENKVQASGAAKAESLLTSASTEASSASDSALTGAVAVSLAAKSAGDTAVAESSAPAIYPDSASNTPSESASNTAAGASAVSTDAISSGIGTTDSAVSTSSYPISDDEQAMIKATAESFTKAYAVFSLKKNASGSETLSYVARDSALYPRLAAYNNDWGVSYSSDSFDKLVIENITKVSEAPDTYTCTVDCVYTVSSGSGTGSYDLDYKYTLIRDPSSGRLLLSDMENI